MKIDLVDHPTIENRKQMQFIDDKAKKFTPRSEIDPFAFVPAKCVAICDVDIDDRVLKVYFLMLRPDLQGTGLLDKVFAMGQEFAGERTIDYGVVASDSVQKLIDDTTKEG